MRGRPCPIFVGNECVNDMNSIDLTHEVNPKDIDFTFTAYCTRWLSIIVQGEYNRTVRQQLSRRRRLLVLSDFIKWFLPLNVLWTENMFLEEDWDLAQLIHCVSTSRKLRLTLPETILSFVSGRNMKMRKKPRHRFSVRTTSGIPVDSAFID
jgi:hypothetical protein